MVWQIPDVVRAVLSSWWWTEKPSETCRASYRNKQRNYASCWLYSANILAINGTMKVKFRTMLHQRQQKVPAYITASSRAIPENPTVPQVAYVLPASYGTHRFVTCLLQPNTCHTNPFYTLPFTFFNICFIIIILAPMPRSSKLSLSLRFPHPTGQKNISLLPCRSHNPHSP